MVRRFHGYIWALELEVSQKRESLALGNMGMHIQWNAAA